MSSKKKSPVTSIGRWALMPKYRFPEFRDAGEWQEMSLGSFLTPVTRNRTKPSETYRGLGLRSHGKGTFLKEQEDPAKNAMDVLYEVKREDLIVNITFAWEGAIAIACSSDDGALVSHRFPTYTISKGLALPEFFKFKIVDKQFVYKLGLISPGGAGRNRVMSKNDFLKLRVLLPSPAEQQKIADCLDSADALIAAQGRKVEALRTHKKGLMQQLFPQEGETQPRLRFPEFEGAGEWGSTILGRLSDVVRGGSPRPIDGFLTNAPDGLNWLKIGDVDKESKYVTKTADKVRHEALSKTRLVNPGDLILSNSMSFGRPFILKISTCIHDGWIAVRRIDAKVIRDFLYYFILSPGSQLYFTGNAAGSGVQNLNADIIKSLPVQFPSLPEQGRIAGVLAALDDLILAETRKLNTLKAHKKGLMQQLFPQIGEDDA